MTAVVPLSLRAENLTLSRGSRPLFTQLGFLVKSGEALILRGANGSGKTSLLRVLAGLTQASRATAAGTAPVTLVTGRPARSAAITSSLKGIDPINSSPSRPSTR